MRAAAWGIPRPFDLAELAAIGPEVNVAKLNDPHAFALYGRDQCESAACEVDAFDYPESAAATRLVGDPAQEILFEAGRQDLAVRRRVSRRADDQETLGRLLCVNRAFLRDRLSAQ